MPGTYTIGQVVKKLSAAYPDLTVSKVRFLESEGIVSPGRTKGGYRAYTDKDVDRLEKALRLQKTCFYPLSVIKERLEAMDAGEELDELPGGQGAGMEELMSCDRPLDELPDLIGVPVAFVRSLQEAGLLALVRSGDGRPALSGQDIPLVRAAYELKRYGIDPRLLKPQVQRANREVPMFKQILAGVVGRAGSLDDPKALAAFDSTLDRLLELDGEVGDCLIRRELRREFNHPSARR